MPAYDYRCTACGHELELVHRIQETRETSAHVRPDDGAPCDGPLERLISLAGLNQAVGTKGPSDNQLARAGFTKYVKGNKGYEKAFGGPDTPNLVPRD